MTFCSWGKEAVSPRLSTCVAAGGLQVRVQWEEAAGEGNGGVLSACHTRGSSAYCAQQFPGVAATIQPHCSGCKTEAPGGMSPASVTLASVLQVRGEALAEEDIWALLSLAAEQLLEDLCKDSSDYVVCPWSALLSVAGSVSFQDRVSHLEAAPFKAPELLQERSRDEQLDVSQVHVYSLGMTLLWSAGFRVPPKQPLQLSEPLHSILLSMCEEQPDRRPPLPSVLEACQAHQEAVSVYPAPAGLHIQRLVGLVLGTISEVERRLVGESSSVQQSRSYLLRKRLHQASGESPAAQALGSLQPCRVSERSTETQSSLEPQSGSSAHSHGSLSAHSASAGATPHDAQECRRLSSASVLSGAAEITLPATPSHKDLLQRNGKFSRPEFVLLAAEAPVLLHLPGSVVTKKGKSYLALRDLCVVLLSGQCLQVKCDIESTAGAVFEAVVSFAHLGELTYFGLAYLKGGEFFFLDSDTRLWEVAPEGWRERPQPSGDPFTLFLRIKFFVSHYELLQHSLTRHQYYLQLRRDILAERLCCDDETLLQLGVLALQAEFGGYPKEQGESKAYFRVEEYLPASLIERMTALRVQVEVSQMHRLSSAPRGEDAELQFLRVAQQLPEYGVLVHRVFPEKKRPEGDTALGVCATGVVVYAVKPHGRTATLWLPWRETGKISTCRKKFSITSSVTGKKHTFVTDSVRTCKYLLGLCSAQHGFHALMGSGQSPQVATEPSKSVQIACLSPAHQRPAQPKPLSWIQRLSCSEHELFMPGLPDTTGGMLSTSLDNFNVGTSKDVGPEGIRGSLCHGPELPQDARFTKKPATFDHLPGLPVWSLSSGSQHNWRESFAAEPGREVVCVTLRRDPLRGFGFVIKEGEDTGHADPGIFVSAIIPGGPAEKAKTIKPGGQILALNRIRLQGFTFSMAVRMIQNSPDTIELIISQCKGVCRNTPGEDKNSTADAAVFSTDFLSHGHQGRLPSHSQDQTRNVGELELAQEQSVMSRLGSQLSSLPVKGAGSSRSPSPSETSAGGIYFVELVKEDGTLGFSVTGGVNTRALYGGIYVKSIIPGGPADKEGQILQGDRLLQVDGMSLCGLTHKQAVQCLKGPGQVASLVLERRSARPAQQCPSANDRTGDGQAAVSLVTAVPGRPTSCVSVTDGPQFEVKLKKNTNGLGFSFVQVERESCNHSSNDLMRIKRLFPGQPAEEHGAIAVGDIILAVNGRSTEGLVFQEVLHLLRAAPEEVTLLLCRPPTGALADVEPGWQTPVPSADEEFTRAACTDSEQSPSLDRDERWRDSTSPDTGECLRLTAEPFQKALREVQGGQGRERPWASSLTHAPESQPHLCRLRRDKEAPPMPTALERDMRQHCYSVCDLRRLGRFSFSSSLTRLASGLF
ncbi:FERM and PDZ domain-containing protein 2 [Lepus europaeus]|uniref:FERM and PDZ domain-containing protein 2 n=1 Tax=Lepus europaeus TaxID=9983 RepID=UPI002B4A9ABA|nr:FERM and PDZ domain-containing protein 2 [Lepus europaeus]